ncbi:hypothetical protein [Streptomyces sp. R08]|uniref:Uncharacterized protein n=1 Tax=Streptomyces sp. R08 TaxID=3238624 RepID=A0AB39MNH7_9ACTN
MKDIIITGPAPDSAPHGVRLSSVVMTHPRRQRAAEQLGTALSVPRLVVDPEPHAAPNPLRTAKVAWGAVSPDATHHAVFQDDISAGADLLDQLAAAAARHPQSAVALYANWDTRNGELVRIAALTGISWVRGRWDEYVPTVALSMPADVARALPGFTRAMDMKFDDEAASLHLSRQRCRTYIPVPNPVEHIGDDSISGMNHHGIRKSACHVVDPDLPESLALGAVLERVDFIPFLRFGESRVVLDHVVGTGDTPLCVEWREALPHMGLAYWDLFDGFRAGGGFSARSDWEQVERTLGGDYALELWIHCFLLGWQVQRVSQHVDPAWVIGSAERLQRLASVAISTIGIGGLPRTRRAEVTPALREALTTAAEHRVSMGRGFAARHRTRAQQ